MSLSVGTNSWATIAETDTYLEDRINATDWFALTESSTPGAITKASILVTAFFWLSNAAELNIAPSVTSATVKNSQAEAALFLLKYFDEYDARRAAISSGLESFIMSKRHEKFNKGNIGIPEYILAMLSDYRVDSGIIILKGEYDE